MTYISNKHLTVTELNRSIKDLLENTFSKIRVVGEVSQLKTHSSGHLYITIKDEQETLSVVCWRTRVQKLKFFPREGKKVYVIGRISAYSPQSKYQLIVEDIELEGEGDLLKILEERKNKLFKKGFFEQTAKKELPFCPKRIGVITSPTGAVIKDICHRIKDRFPLELILFPVRVQGEMAANEIINGIKKFNDWSKNSHSDKLVDLIIIARGGGSLEDLMAFNEESLVEEIFKSKLPIISAVGHESDITLCDFVSDLRAPTPSAAAELVVPVRSDLLKKLNVKKSFLDSLVKNQIDKVRIKFFNNINKLPKIENIIQLNFQKLDLTEIRFKKSINENIINKKLLLKKILEQFKPETLIQKMRIGQIKLENSYTNINEHIRRILLDRKSNITQKENLLESLSYKKIIKRGYTVVRKENKVVTNSKQIKSLEKLEVEFFDGKVNVKKID